MCHDSSLHLCWCSGTFCLLLVSTLVVMQPKLEDSHGGKLLSPYNHIMVMSHAFRISPAGGGAQHITSTPPQCLIPLFLGILWAKLPKISCSSKTNLQVREPPPVPQWWLYGGSTPPQYLKCGRKSDMLPPPEARH